LQREEYLQRLESSE